MLFHRKWILTMGILALTPSVAMAGPFSWSRSPKANQYRTRHTVRAQSTASQNQKIAEQIAAALKKSRLSGRDIDIQVSNGVATIKGKIANAQQRQTATRAIKAVPGVQRVQNQMSLLQTAPQSSAIAPVNHTKSATPAAKKFTNQEVAQKIANTLKQSGIKGYNIGIRYQNGEAQISGTVADPSQVARATQAISQVPGVKTVRNNLQSVQMRQAPIRPVNYQPMPPMGGGQPMPPMGGGQPMGSMGGGAPMGPPPGAGMPSRSPSMPPMGGGYGPPPSSRIYNQANLPKNAWPSYAQYNNYAAVNYPKQYSASAFPYIGPFYPYPQVPMGWRKASLEWEDGGWNMKFGAKTDRWWWFMSPKNW